MNKKNGIVRPGGEVAQTEPPGQRTRAHYTVCTTNYDRSQFKPYLESPHRLSELEEARGQLLRIFESEGQCIAVFAWGAISLPAEIEQRLRPLVGHKVACMRLDGKIRIRDLEAEDATR